jgi:hypothetical protein
MARLLLALLAAAFLAAGCGSDDKKSSAQKSGVPTIKDPAPDRHDFHIFADANRYAGPTPLTTNFKVGAFRGHGTVRYHWTFDDGTTSTEQNPTHTFKKAGSYTVLVDAKDQDNFNDRWNLVLGVWPVDVWNARKPIEQRTKNEIKALQADQARRTAKRIHELQVAGLPTSAPNLKPKPEPGKGSPQAPPPQ